MRLQAVIFGSTGMIGSALVRAIRVDDAISGSIEIARGVHGIFDFITDVDLCKRVIINQAQGPLMAFYCVGPTDPTVPHEIHEKFHVELPAYWRKWLQENTDLLGFCTFGSIHESIQSVCESNSYLNMKRKWHLQFLQEALPRCYHIQLHTLYGKPLRSNSFLGQMFRALQSNEKFRMSAGLQLREYHHVDDIISVVLKLSRNIVDGCSCPNILTLSHGRPISLKQLTCDIFSNLGRSHLLELGGIPGRLADIFEIQWQPTVGPWMPSYRDPVKGICDLFKDTLFYKSQPNES